MNSELAERAICWIFCRSREAGSGAVLEFSQLISRAGKRLRCRLGCKTSVVQSGNFTQERQLVDLRQLLTKLKLVFVKRFTTPTPFVFLLANN